MILPIPSGRITAPFSQPRPLGAAPTHVHGAIDVAPTSIHGVVAPVSGRAQFLQFLRPNITTFFPADDKDIILRHPTHNYFYDLYGGICTIIDKHTGYLHVLTHFWASALWSRSVPVYTESRVEGRFPCVALIGTPFVVKEGAPLCPVGNAGFSTGPHVHWEIHPSSEVLSPYADRLDPEALLKGASHA